jgi:hypothetical protein
MDLSFSGYFCQETWALGDPESLLLVFAESHSGVL